MTLKSGKITVNNMLILGEDSWTDGIKPHLKPDIEIKARWVCFGISITCPVNKLRHILRAPVSDKHLGICWHRVPIINLPELILEL